MNIYTWNATDPELVLWYKIAAQYFLKYAAAGFSGEPQPFPVDTITVLQRKTVNYTAALAGI